MKRVPWRVDFFNRLGWLYELTRRLFEQEETDISRLLPKGIKLLADIGGGSGTTTKSLLKSSKKVVIIDPSYKMVELARRRGLSAIIGSAENTGLKAKSCGAITCIYSLHHFEDARKAVSEMHRILSKNGVVLVQELNRNRIEARILWFFEKAFGLGSRFYSPEELAQIFREAGFRASVFDNKKLRFYVKAEKVQK